MAPKKQVTFGPENEERSLQGDGSVLLGSSPGSPGLPKRSKITPLYSAANTLGDLAFDLAICFDTTGSTRRRRY